MNIKTKKAQASETFIILLLLVFFVVIGLFLFLNSNSQRINNLQYSLKHYQELYAKSSAKSVPLITSTQRIPIAELLNDYICYNSAEYFINNPQNTIYEIKRIMNELYEDRWCIKFTISQESRPELTNREVILPNEKQCNKENLNSFKTLIPLTCKPYNQEIYFLIGY